MNLIIFFVVTAACIFYLSLPYFRKNSGSLIDLDNLSELRKERVLLELNNELENGTITIEQFNELREELFKIESIEKENADNVNETKIILANEATAMLHGLDKAKKSEETARNIFKDNNLSTDLPTIELNSKELEKEILLSDLILRVNFASSKSASRKLIRGNAVKIDKELIKDELFSVNRLLSSSSDGLVISVGKKKYFRILATE